MGLHRLDPERVVQLDQRSRIVGERIHGLESGNELGDYRPLFGARPVLVLAAGDRLVARTRQPACIPQHTGHGAGGEVPESDDAVDGTAVAVQLLLGLAPERLEVKLAVRRTHDLVVAEQADEPAGLGLADGPQLAFVELVEPEDENVAHRFTVDPGAHTTPPWRPRMLRAHGRSAFRRDYSEESGLKAPSYRHPVGAPSGAIRSRA